MGPWLRRKAHQPASSVGVSAAPSPGEEGRSTPTPPSDVEDWITAHVGPGVATVPLGEETMAIPDLTPEPENQTGWTPAYTPTGAFPPPGMCGLPCLGGQGAR